MRYELGELKTYDALDCALLIYIIKQIGLVQGRTKIQKATFLSELTLREHGFVGPQFKFFRYRNGPFSVSLWDCLDELIRRGFVNRLRGIFEVAPRGDILIEMIFPELRSFPTNRKFFRFLDDALDHCRPRTGQQLMEEIYQMRIRPAEFEDLIVKVADMPLGTEIIVPPKGHSIEISEELSCLLREELNLTVKNISEARETMADELIDFIVSLNAARQPS